MSMLVFEKDKQKSGNLVKGYHENWDIKKEGGSYNTGYNFLSVH